MSGKIVRPLGAVLAALVLVAGKAAAFDHFITADGGELKDGARPFRFVSFNIPNLNDTEDDRRFRQTVPYRLPAEFEMREADKSYVGDPPQEPQGRNSVFDCDATTLAVLRDHAARLG